MANVRINSDNVLGKIKPLHCTVNGPVANHDGSGGTVNGFKTAGIPYARLHDSSFFDNYGGEHTVDISGIFPNFDSDPYDEASYDFYYTDMYIKRTLDVGTKIFYRLGQRIEVRPKKYHVVPPKDFKKWAVICEHIIRHYNEGWANGFEYGIEFWEVWNEPDNRPACWTGTMEQFYDFFEIAVKHLKGCFPNIKIGGPALAEWSVDNGNARKFIETMRERNVPLDFLSWHTYSRVIEDYTKRAVEIRDALDANGYKNALSIVDEWNYLVDWKAGMEEGRRKRRTVEGAAFVSANQATVQNTSIDMLMYYDARPCGFCSLWEPFYYDFYKPFYSMAAFNKLYRLGTQVEITSDDKDVYALAATNGEKKAAVVTYYTYEADMPEKHVTVELDGDYDIYLLDETRDLEHIGEASGVCGITLKPNSVVLFESK